jgi:hypothetical protein
MSGQPEKPPKKITKYFLPIPLVKTFCTTNKISTAFAHERVLFGGDWRLVILCWQRKFLLTLATSND